MDSSGLFIALIVGLLSTEIFRILTGNKHLIVKMPDGVPPAVAKSFEALFPAMITIIFWGFVTTLFNAAHIANVVTWFSGIVMTVPVLFVTLAALAWRLSVTL